MFDFFSSHGNQPTAQCSISMEVQEFSSNEDEKEVSEEVCADRFLNCRLL